MENREVLLQTIQLTIGYQKALLRDLNLTLSRGKLTCFMGPNGIGKSTLIRTLAGLQKPVSGTVVMRKGQLPSALAVVLTDKISSAYLTVRDIVAFGRYPYLEWNLAAKASDLNVVNESIAKVGITHLADKRLEELSDGQLQLAMIARAVAQDTPVILLDEPTAHLDLNNRLQVMNLLRDLAHHNDKSILVATHELDLALQTADDIWLAGRNQEIHSGIPEDLILSGIFDEVFELKGFDLRTGRVIHPVSRAETIDVVGYGFAWQWTKNALERSGFSVSSENPSHQIRVSVKDDQVVWELDNSEHFHAISALLHHLTR